MMTTQIKHWYRCFRNGVTAIPGTLICALVVVFLDAVLDGSYLFSALVCPMWLLASVVRTMVWHRRFAVAAAQILVPIAVGLFVTANYYVQGKTAMANAAHLIQACERYREVNGAYPERLGDLVPRYLNSIPRAKYCCCSNEFSYHAMPQRHTLSWREVPPFGRQVYCFETGTWHFID